MVNLKTIKKSNDQLDQSLKSFRPVAVFVGATNGIGRNSLRSFVKSTRAAGAKPRIYFVGRSRQRGDEIKAELVSINPDGEYEFVCANVGEMAVVDDVCRDILKREKYLNLLFMSQGTAQHGAGQFLPYL